MNNAVPATVAPDPGRPLVIRGGTVLTMDDSHRVLTGGDVVVVDGKIAEIGIGAEAPPDAHEIDAAGGKGVHSCDTVAGHDAIERRLDERAGAAGEGNGLGNLAGIGPRDFAHDQSGRRRFTAGLGLTWISFVRTGLGRRGSGAWGVRAERVACGVEARSF